AEGALAAARRARELATSDRDVVDYLADLNLAEALFINGLAGEGVPLFERALEIYGENDGVRAGARLTTRAAIALCRLQRCVEARTTALQAVALARNRGAVGIVPYALLIVAWAARRTGAWPEAVAAADEGATLARELGQTATAGQCLQELATLAACRGE